MRHEIELPVYTSIFRLQRRLYRVYDIELPVPVTFVQLVVFATTFVADVTLLGALEVEFTPGSAWAFLVPPAALAWLLGRPSGEQRSPARWLIAQIRYLVEPTHVSRLAAHHAPDTVRFTARVVERTAPAAPTEPVTVDDATEASATDPDAGQAPDQEVDA